MVVPHFVTREHNTILNNVFCVERRDSTPVVGDAICLCLGFYCYPPNWSHSSNYQPGDESTFLFVVFLLVFALLKDKKLIFNVELEGVRSCGFHDVNISMFLLTTMQQPGYDIIAQFIIGYVLPGKPIANLLFKIYGRISTVHALSFLSDLKLGHYMKIPPRCMYTAQVSAAQIYTLISELCS
jgi:hypothetical protein